MGLDRDGMMFLAACKADGADFTKMLTIGHQNRCVDPGTIRRTMTRVGCFDQGLFDDIVKGTSAPFADEVFRMLGAKTLDVLDVSDHEGANIIHNLNVPVSDGLKGQYDVIFDGGALEHIFNCPVALKSYMDMLKVGGSLMITVPANNWMGHGFYQLGSDFFYRALSAENGFRVRRMVISALGPFKRSYEVADAREIGERVDLISMFRQMAIFVHAEKIGHADVFQAPPQQQSYDGADLETWQSHAKKAHERAVRMAAHPATSCLSRVLEILHPLKTAWEFYSTMTILNRRHFRPVSMITPSKKEKPRHSS